MLNNLFTCYCSGVSCVRQELQVTLFLYLSTSSISVDKDLGSTCGPWLTPQSTAPKPFLSLQPSNKMLFVCHSCQGLRSISGAVNPSWVNPEQTFLVAGRSSLSADNLQHYWSQMSRAVPKPPDSQAAFWVSGHRKLCTEVSQHHPLLPVILQRTGS